MIANLNKIKVLTDSMEKAIFNITDLKVRSKLIITKKLKIRYIFLQPFVTAALESVETNT